MSLVTPEMRLTPCSLKKALDENSRAVEIPLVNACATVGIVATMPGCARIDGDATNAICVWRHMWRDADATAHFDVFLVGRMTKTAAPYADTR